MDGIDLTPMYKRGLKQFIPDLKERDDFDFEMITTECIRCGGEDYTWKYRFHGENQWHVFQKKYHCGACEINDYFKNSKTEHNQKVQESLIERYWHIPNDLQEAGFKNFERTSSITNKAADICTDYVKHFKSNQPEKRFNMLIMGNPGTGKSHLSVAIARTLRASNFKVGFLTTGKLLSMIKSTYQKGASRTENDILEDLSKFDLLVLDDLGAEQSSKDEFAWSKKTLFEIVNLRSGKPTIYTTNYDDLSIAEVVGERVASRLYVNSKYIDMFTNDYRKRLKVN